MTKEDVLKLMHTFGFEGISDFCVRNGQIMIGRCNPNGTTGTYRHIKEEGDVFNRLFGRYGLIVQIGITSLKGAA